MKLATIALCLLMAAPLFGANKNDYQDAVLVSFRTISTGESCSGNTDGKVDDDGRITANSNSNCSNSYTRLYTVAVRTQTYILRPTRSKKGQWAAFGTLGWSAALGKQSVLNDQLPGSHVLIRSGSDGIHIRVGKRESKYEVVQTQ